MAKSETSAKKELKNVILTAYMDAVLEQEVHPTVQRLVATFHFAL